MSRISIPKLALVLVLATLLTPPAGWSAGRRFFTDDYQARIFTLENPLVAFWSYLMGILEKEGCGIDPSGLCKTNPSTNSDAGCGLDPHGSCTPSTGSTNGSTTNQDAGCGIDPHGGCVSGN